MKIIKYFFFAFVISFLICAAYIYYEATSFINTPPNSQENAQTLQIDILQGSSVQVIAAQLADAGIIIDAKKFTLLVRYKKLGNKIQAGRFEFTTDMLPTEVLDKLQFGKAILHRITLREGLTWWETAKKLEEEGFCTYEDFKTIIHDKEFLNHFTIPFNNAEGFLYPETYLLEKADVLNLAAAKKVASRLVDTFWQKADKIWLDGKRPNRTELKRLVILASIIEKETGIPSERSIVSGVYTNRLKINMLLQADPTVIYGLGENFSGKLLFRHLEDTKNTYNTYTKGGLPPGPIASFGISALEAAIYPEEHKYLYFVATGTDGGHTFSTNLNDHNKAVLEYRKKVK